MADKKNDSYNLDDLMDQAPEEEEKGLFDTNNDDEQEESTKDKHRKKNEKKRKNLNASFESATQSTRDKKKNKFDMWGFVKKHVLKYLIGLIVGLVLGIMLFGGGSSQEENKQVYEINKGISIEDQIDNVRASQNDAIRQQFSSLRDDNGSLTEEQDKIAGLNENIANSIDPFLKEVMNNPLNPTEKEITKRTNKLKDLATSENDEKNYDKSAIDNLLRGNSAAKELGEAGVKSGSTFAGLVGVDKKKNNVFFTITPYTTKNQTVNVLYLIKTNNDGKYVTGSYLGYMHADDKNRAKYVYDYLANSLKGDVNADQVNKAIVNSQDQSNIDDEKAKKAEQDKEKADQKKAEEKVKDKNKKADQKKEKQDKNKKDDKQKKDDKK